MNILKIGLAAIFLVSCLYVTACNTMKGVGQDTEAAGEAIEKKAKKEGAE